MQTANLTPEQEKQRLDDMKAYFKDLGFTSSIFADGVTGDECYGHPFGMSVIMSPKRGEVEISVIDGMIRCTTGQLGFPNKNIPMFVRRLQRHIFD